MGPSNFISFSPVLFDSNHVMSCLILSCQVKSSHGFDDISLLPGSLLELGDFSLNSLDSRLFADQLRNKLNVVRELLRHWVILRLIHEDYEGANAVHHVCFDNFAGEQASRAALELCVRLLCLLWGQFFAR